MSEARTRAKACRSCGKSLPVESFGTYLGRSGTKRKRFRRNDCNPCRRGARRAVYMDKVLLELGAAEETDPKWC